MGSSLLSIGTRALAANQAALQVTGNNIANANTVGYSRQSVQMQSSSGQFLGNGYFGKGVDVTTVERTHSDFLTRQAALTRSADAADSTRSEKLSQLESIFASGSNGIGASANSMLNAFSDVVNSPSDLTARAVVISQGEETAARFRTASGQLDDLQQGVNAQLKSDADSINTLAQKVASLNEQIANARGTDHTPNDLLDQREQAISDLNQYVQTSSVPAQDGTVSLFVGGSQPLVLGAKVSQLKVTRDEFDPFRSQLSISQQGQSIALDTTALSGGEVAGLLRFQNTDMEDARNMLGRMAVTLGTMMNDQHKLGVDLNGQTGGDFFKMPPMPDGVPATTNTGNASVQSAVLDASQLRASSYELRFEAGQINVTRLSDGSTSSFSSMPVQMDGLQFQIGSGATQTGDRFVISPFGTAAAKISSAVTSPRSLAVASPVAAQVGAGNTGSVAVQSLMVQQADPNQSAPVTLKFTAAGTFDVVGTGTGNPSGVAYVPGQAISYNGWSLTLKGTPQPGDTLVVSNNTATGSTAGNAQAMLALRDATAFEGSTVSDGYATVLSEIGTRVQGGQSAAQISKSIATDAAQAKSSVSGVNLDEEAAKLLQYQQSYQAAAKMLQVAQGVFDSLLQGLGR